MKKRTVCIMLVICMIISCMTSVSISVSAQSADIAEEGAANYGLADKCRDGNILHCFNWTLNQIKDELPNIAQAGFTSVQTSPLQGHDGRNQWYWLYQPTGFSIGNELGSYDDLKALCSEADKYGIKIIVDVVANHLAGSNNGTWANSIESDLKKSGYFHNLGACNDWDNRYDITHKNIGMPDLNSENKDIQNKVYSMIEKLESAGADGIRWDAAKHISLPSEDCAFWSKMAESDLYQYGEILDNPAGKSGDAVNNALMTEYAQYIGVTDSTYSSDIMNAVKSGTMYKTNGNWLKKGVAADRIVYWAESHDTYANDGTDGWTKNIDQKLIDKAYAIVGARADSQALYLSRPSEKAKTSIYYGKKGSTHFTSKEVAAVNHFHNAMIGKAEKYSATAGCYVVWREGGAVIVSMNGSDVDVSVNNSGSMVPVGTYTDEVSGSEWTVTETKITGHIGNSGIAVVYNAEQPSEELILGDVDGDLEATVIDATYVQRYATHIPVPIDDEVMEKCGDADGDGDVSIVDATFIQRYASRLPTPYKIGEVIQD